jgi:hypothetical protein
MNKKKREDGGSVPCEGYVINILIPIDKMKELGIDRDAFKKFIEENASKFLPDTKVEYIKGKSQKP